MPDGTFATVHADREAAVGVHDKVRLRPWPRLPTRADPVEREARSRPRARFALSLPRFDLSGLLTAGAEGGRRP